MATVLVLVSLKELYQQTIPAVTPEHLKEEVMFMKSAQEPAKLAAL
jgi:hypothetical protein